LSLQSIAKSLGSVKCSELPVLEDESLRIIDTAHDCTVITYSESLGTELRRWIVERYKALIVP
jgi:hypothetical protein